MAMTERGCKWSAVCFARKKQTVFLVAVRKQQKGRKYKEIVFFQHHQNPWMEHIQKFPASFNGSKAMHCARPWVQRDINAILSCPVRYSQSSAKGRQIDILNVLITLTSLNWLHQHCVLDCKLVGGILFLQEALANIYFLFNMIKMSHKKFKQLV